MILIDDYGDVSPCGIDHQHTYILINNEAVQIPKRGKKEKITQCLYFKIISRHILYSPTSPTVDWWTGLRVSLRVQ